MIEIKEVLAQIEIASGCFVYPSEGLPNIHSEHILPDDLQKFYQLCGGVSLFRSSAYSINIVSPNKFLLANPVLFTGISEEDLHASKGDISWSWYIVGEGENGQYITIDLSPERLGRCYDSFWDCHAMPGYSQIVAKSFSELLLRLFENQGKHWYWLQSEFKSYGDAYGEDYKQ